jgi:transposase
MATQPAESRVVLTPEQREQLERIAKSRSLPAGLVARARIILMSAEATKVQIAQTLGISRTTVAKWQHRFCEGGVTGLYDELRPGRPRSVSDERVARLVKRTLETKPSHGTHWSVRQIAAESKLTKSTVHRIVTLRAAWATELSAMPSCHLVFCQALASLLAQPIGILGLLRRPDGASLKELMKVTGWWRILSADS